MKKILFLLSAAASITTMAQKEITAEMLQSFRDSYKSIGADKALDNAVAANDLKAEPYVVDSLPNRVVRAVLPGMHHNVCIRKKNGRADYRAFCT